MLYYSRGSPGDILLPEDLKAGLFEALGRLGTRKSVLAVPPDITRVHSQAGLLTRLSREYYQDRLAGVLPALGTHAPMTEQEIARMFGDMPRRLFHVHDWRKDVVTLGEVPADFIARESEGRVGYPWSAQVNRRLVEGGHDLILSLGQVVPHEVAGMANYNKNIFVGTGGPEGIHKSHFLGAVYGMERIMGRADNPVRRVLNYAGDRFAGGLPIVYALTVVAPDAGGNPRTKGLFIGDDVECFRRASDLSLQVNVQVVEKPLPRVVVYLEPGEFRSLWLGNKSIYRTRMAIADGGELIVLAPGLKEFGEDGEIDALIRAHGYVGTPEVLRLVGERDDLKRNLGAAAHLIHGSTEGRFSVTVCPGRLSRGEIEGVNYRYADLGDMMKRYDPAKLRDGFHAMPGGEEIFYISNPALGLWASRKRFEVA